KTQCLVQPRRQVDAITLACSYHPGHLVPPRQPRRIDESAGDKERGGNSLLFQDGKRGFVVVAVTIIERDHGMATAAFCQYPGQVGRTDDVQLLLAEAQLLREVIDACAPQPPIEIRSPWITYAVVVERQHARPADCPIQH